jgi:hypothetical protein
MPGRWSDARSGCTRRSSRFQLIEMRPWFGGGFGGYRARDLRHAHHVRCHLRPALGNRSLSIAIPPARRAGTRGLAGTGSHHHRLRHELLRHPGIGSFATTTTLYKLLKLVPDERIPGTMLAGHTLPVVVHRMLNSVGDNSARGVGDHSGARRRLWLRVRCRRPQCLHADRLYGPGRRSDWCAGSGSSDGRCHRT